MLTGSGGTLAGVTIGTGTVLDGTKSSNASVTITGGLTLSGSVVDVGSATSSNTAQLYFQGSQTLGGSGSVVLGT